ncbi:MAG: hypothetical protein GWN93_05895 [Deltaproteobacteria bacterium]|nr:hypothetical protein [Deltaproteobacteria bacterium]
MKSITKLCNMFGVGHLADEVAAETMLLVCLKAAQYNPQRASFNTWVIEQAKGVVHRVVEPSKHVRYGGEKTHGVHIEYEHMFAESEPLPLSDDGDPLTPGEAASPSALVIRAEDWVESSARVTLFLESLTDTELACLRLLLRDGSVRYRQLGEALGVSHTHAGKLLPGILEGLQDKAVTHLRSV